MEGYIHSVIGSVETAMGRVEFFCGSFSSILEAYEHAKSVQEANGAECEVKVLCVPL